MNYPEKEQILMYCPKCGTANLDNALICQSCKTDLSQLTQQTPQVPSPPPPPQNSVTIYLASRKERFFAFIIDVIILFLISTLTFTLLSPLSTALVLEQDLGDPNSFISILKASLPLSIPYFVDFLITNTLLIGLMAFFGGSPGKLLLKIEVVNNQFKKPDYFRVLFRETVGKFVSAVVLLIGYIFILFDKQRRGWHDSLSGTYVIKRSGAISFNRQPLWKTVLFILSLILLSVFFGITTAIGIQYTAYGEASYKELNTYLQQYFDRDTKINQELYSISDIINNALDIQNTDVIELDKQSVQVQDISHRLDILASDLDFNLTTLESARGYVSNSIPNHEQYTYFFEQLSEAQILLSDTLKNYSLAWKSYESAIVELINIMKYDRRIIQTERSFKSAENSNQLLEIIEQNKEEYSTISQKMGDSVQIIKDSSSLINLNPSLVEVIDNEASIAEALSELANVNPKNTKQVNTALAKYNKHAQFLSSNPILAAYNAWLDVGVIPNLTKYSTDFERAFSQIDEANKFYDENILGIPYQQKFPEDEEELEGQSI